jgi:hypothetical protein
MRRLPHALQNNKCDFWSVIETEAEVAVSDETSTSVKRSMLEAVVRKYGCGWFWVKAEQLVRQRMSVLGYS